MKKIAFYNPQGGCGKTTTVWELGTRLQKKGYKVLLIDLDIQMNLSLMAGIDLHDSLVSLYDVLINNKNIEQAVYTLMPGLDIIIGGQELFIKDTELINKYKDYVGISEQLEHLKTSYDYCIIDTAPYVNAIMASALIASDSLIIPIQNEVYCINSVRLVTHFLDQAVKPFNHKIKIEGLLLMNMIKNGKLLQKKDIARKLETTVFHTEIHSMYSEPEKAITDYDKFVDEFLDRFEK